MYERLESEFKAKMKAEKLFMESRVQELKNENEVLNQQKQDLKSSMRMERLELCKRFEKEKEELAEKYRNELKELRKSLEKTVVINNIFTCSASVYYTQYITIFLLISLLQPLHNYYNQSLSIPVVSTLV